MRVLLAALLSGVALGSGWSTIFYCDGNGKTANRVADNVWANTVQKATKVRICTKGQYWDCVTSKNNNVAITRLKSGESSLQDPNQKACNSACVNGIWDGASRRLHQMTYWCGPNRSGEDYIWHSCGNAGGLHMDMAGNGPCEWDWGTNDALEVQVYKEDTPAPTMYYEWENRNEHWSINYCDNLWYMSGMCASGRGWDCSGNPGKIRCTKVDDAVAQHSPRWETQTEHGYDVQCNIDQGMTAVGLCTSGGRWDCKCTGGQAEGCPNQGQRYSHMLRCAIGAELAEPRETTERTGGWGQNIWCPNGYVVYKVCSSGHFYDCKDRYGTKVSHKIGCVRTKESLKPGSPQKTMKTALGIWYGVSSHNRQFKHAISSGLTDASGTEITTTESKDFGFSQDLSVAVKVNHDALGTLDAGVETTASIGATQEFGQEVTNSVIKSWSEVKTDSDEFNCGTDNTGNWALWQWYWFTETADGEKGPDMETFEMKCVPGSLMQTKRPRCTPHLCMNDENCYVCQYDYCKIESVSGGTFTVKTDCIDLAIGTETWGGQIEIELNLGDPKLKYYSATNTGGIRNVTTAMATLTRGAETSTGYWNDATGKTAFAKGQRIRILRVVFAGRSIAEVAMDGVVWAGLPVMMVALLAFTYRSWSKSTHSEITDGLLA